MVRPILLTVGVEDTPLQLNPDSFGFNNYVDPDGDVFTTVQIVSHSEDIDPHMLRKVMLTLQTIRYLVAIWWI